MKNKLSMYIPTYVGFEVFCSVISSSIGVIFLNVKTELFRYKKQFHINFLKRSSIVVKTETILKNVRTFSKKEK